MIGKEEEEKECGNEVPCRGRGPCYAAQWGEWKETTGLTVPLQSGRHTFMLNTYFGSCFKTPREYFGCFQAEEYLPGMPVA